MMKDYSTLAKIIAFILAAAMLLFATSCTRHINKSLVTSDITRVQNQQTSNVFKADSIGVKTSEQKTLQENNSISKEGIKITFRPDTSKKSSGPKKPIIITNSDNGYVVDPGDMDISDITLSKTKKDQVKRSDENKNIDSSHVARSDSAGTNEKDSSSVTHKTVTAKKDTKTGLPVFSFIGIVALIILGIYVYRKFK